MSRSRAPRRRPPTPPGTLVLQFVAQCDDLAAKLSLTRDELAFQMFLGFEKDWVGWLDQVESGEFPQTLDGLTDNLRCLNELAAERGVAVTAPMAPALIPISGDLTALPAMVQRAAAKLAGATTAAEVLEARADASIVYDAAKAAGRIARAKKAHDDILAAVYHAQADALEIEAAAKRRLADEYDAAQERGDVATPGQPKSIVPDGNITSPATISDIGLSRKDIHEARIIRDAEKAEPGIVHRVVTERVERRQEPTKAAIREAVIEAAQRGLRSVPSQSRKNPYYEPNPQFDAASKMAGACRDITDLIKTHGCDFILGGFFDAAMRDRNLNSFEAARDDLSRLLEAADAQPA